jgi:hypothetical protein
MAIVNTTTQYSYTGPKPLDSKALVQTYAKLLSTATWTVDGKNIAYNGMITAVWLDKETVDGESKLSDKNGIYFLHDPNVTSTRNPDPDVTNEANWHRLGGIDNLPGLADQVASIQAELEALQSDVSELQESATEVVELFEQLPETGKAGKLYVVTEDATTYVWHNGKYLLVGDGADENDIQIIHGGSAN